MLRQALVLIILFAPLGAKAAEQPTRLRRAGSWLQERALDVTDYLHHGFAWGGLGFVFRRPEQQELEDMRSQRWTRSWHQKEEPFRFRHLPRYLWPYQWPVRIATRLMTGQQYLFTPGAGLANAMNRMTCHRVAEAVTGKLVLTRPAKFLLQLAPAVGGIYGLTEAAKWGQTRYLENRIQKEMAEMLDREIETNLLLKSQRLGLKRGQLSREDARRQAFLLLKESEGYYRRIAEVLPKNDNDATEEEAFLLWSLGLLAFNDLYALEKSRELEMDETRYLYPEHFIPIVDDGQMRLLVYSRHATLLKMRGAETLLNDVSRKNPALQLDAAGLNVRESRAVQEVLRRFRDKEIDESTARKWIHIYLDWDQELSQMRILGFAKKARENGEFVNRPVTIEDIEKDIISALDRGK